VWPHCVHRTPPTVVIDGARGDWGRITVRCSKELDPTQTQLQPADCDSCPIRELDGPAPEHVHIRPTGSGVQLRCKYCGARVSEDDWVCQDKCIGWARHAKRYSESRQDETG
jgi:hypothetical protein